MRDRIILAGLAVLLILAAILIFLLSRIDPPLPATSDLIDDHDHVAELLPPAPLGRTLFGGNSGELRASPVAIARATSVTRAGTPVANTSFEVFAPARFQATPVGDPASAASPSSQASTVTTTVSTVSTVQTIG